MEQDRNRIFSWRIWGRPYVLDFNLQRVTEQGSWLTDGGRESVPFLQFDFRHLDYEDDLQSLRNSNTT